MPAPTGHAYAVVAGVIVGYAILHVAIALLIAAFAAARIRAGYVSPTRTLELRLATLFADFAGGVTLIGLAVLLLPVLA